MLAGAPYCNIERTAGAFKSPRSEALHQIVFTPKNHYFYHINMYILQIKVYVEIVSARAPCCVPEQTAGAFQLLRTEPLH